jgi:signal transduction histidine kinase
MSEMATGLSEFIRRCRSEIIVAWETRARAEILPAHLTQEQVLDSLNLLLDELADVLSRRPTLGERAESALARAHGRERHTVQLDVGAVVREYAILFECILDVARARGKSLDLAAVIDLSRAIQIVAAEAVDEFVQKSRTEVQAAAFEHFAFLAHEVQSPLSATLLAFELGRSTGEIEGPSAERLRRGLEKVRELIDHAIAESRREVTGAGPGLQREPVVFAALLEDVIQELTPQAANRQVTLSLQAHGELTLLGDRHLLRSAVGNLVGNAVKFTRRGGKVTVHSNVQEGHVRITVEDQCGGIPVEDVERLFESFMQGSQRRGGHGLGLAIARQAIEAHAGTIAVRNLPPAGCIFVVELPLGG